MPGHGREIQHGAARRGKQTPEYVCWCHMRKRCQNPRATGFADYGGRGIKVCDRWASFVRFLADMGQRPGPGFSIERMKVDGDYTPDNCVWGTRSDQARNQRLKRSNTSGVMGVHLGKQKNKWRVRITANGKRLSIGEYDTLAEATARRAAAEQTHWGR